MFRALMGLGIRPFWVGFLGVLAALAVLALVVLVIHLWSDHRALHVVVDYLNSHADKINKLP